MKTKDANRLMISMSGLTYKEVALKLGVAGPGAVRGIGITNNTMLAAWIRLSDACGFDVLLKSSYNEYLLSDPEAPLVEERYFPKAALLALKAEAGLSWAGVARALGRAQAKSVSCDPPDYNYSTDVMIRMAESCGYELKIRFRETGEEFKLNARQKSE